MKEKKFIILLFLLIFIALPKTVKADSKYIGDHIGTEYNDAGSIPQTVIYNSGGYKGTLYLQSTRVSSGTAPRTIYYDGGDFEYTILDYCQWNKSTYKMVYKYCSAYPDSSKEVTVEGYTFTAYLSAYKKGVRYTKYAARDMDPYRGQDSYPDDSWIGSSNVTNGQIYNSAIHYYNGRYTGDYTTPDTRKYVGVYAGTVTRPGLENYDGWVEEAPYYNGTTATYWVKPNQSVVIEGRARSNPADYDYAPHNIYFSFMSLNGLSEYGRIGLGEGANRWYYSYDYNPWFPNDVVMTDSYTVRNSFANGYGLGRVRLSLRNDNMNFLIRHTSSTNTDGYLEAPSWRDLTFLRSDGVAPTVTDIRTENVTVNGFDVVVSGLSDNGKSGTHKLRTCTWIDGWNLDGQWQDWYTGDGDYRIHINTSAFGGRFGNYKMDIYTVDNVGNSDIRGSINVDVEPKPIINAIKMIKWDYKQDDYNYWIKLGNTGQVYTDGYLPGDSPVYPNRNYVGFAKDGNFVSGTSPVQWASTTENKTYGSQYATYFNFIGTDRAVQSSPDGHKYLYTTHTFKPLVDNTAFKLYSTTSYQGDYEYFNPYKDSGIWVRVDGTKPTGIFTPYTQAWTNSNSLSISFDPSDSGSGVKQWRYAISTDNGATWGTWSSYILGDTTSSITLNSAESQSTQFKVKTEVADNVGNIDIITSGTYQFDRVKPTASASPAVGNWVNNGHSVTIIYADTHSGVATKQYAWSTSTATPSTWTNYTTAVSQSTEGIWYLHYRVVDNAGNVSTGYFGAYKVDKTLPTATANPSSGNWINSSHTVNINFADTLSGVATKQYAWSTSTATPSTWTNYTTAVSQSTEGIWYLHYRVVDNAGNVSMGYFGAYKVDKTLPSGVFTPNEVNVAILTTTTNFKPSDLGGSGVKEWRYRTSSDNGVTWGDWSSYIIGETAYTISLNSVAKWKVQAEVKDNAGNINTLTSGTFNVIYPNPISKGLVMYEYDYKQDNNNYWVKPNSTIGVYTEGYFPSDYGIYPSRTYVLFAKDGVMNINTSARQYADITGSYLYGTEYSTYFNLKNSSEKAQQFVNNGNNYLGIRHHLTAKVDRTAFKLYHNSAYINGTEYSNDYIDSGIWLRVDGTAPTGNAIVNLDYLNLNLNMSVRNVVDIGSGVNKVWCELYPSDDVSKKVSKDLSLVNGDWILSNLNAYDLFNSTDIKVDIYAKDNVGNVALIKSSIFDLFTVAATIAPIGNPDFIGVPSLMQGQKAVLKITTTGAPTKLTISFPSELVELDSTLNKELAISPEKHLITNVEFYVPLTAATKVHTVNVKAYKGAKTKEAVPQFNVNGNILDGIKTRTLYK